MVDGGERRKGFRAQWAQASQKQKLASAAMIAVTLAIIVFGIIPLMRAVYVAGQNAVR